MSPGVAYYFNSIYWSSVTGISSLVYQGNFVGPGVPDVPANVSGVVGDGQVAASWDAVSGNGDAVSAYTVWTFLADGSSSSNATSYRFKVFASNSVGDSALSSASAGATPAVLPTIPKTLTQGCSADSSITSNINCLSNIDISVASSDTFTPNATVNRGTVASFLARLWKVSGQSCPTASSPFTDVSNSVVGPDINCVYQVGLTRGTSSFTFSPDEKMPREQLAAFLGRLRRLSGRTCPAGSSPFGDASGSLARADIDPPGKAIVRLLVDGERPIE